jgi:hypothetical protein
MAADIDVSYEQRGVALHGENGRGHRRVLAEWQVGRRGVGLFSFTDHHHAHHAHDTAANRGRSSAARSTKAAGATLAAASGARRRHRGSK